jgi:hypothetical protein
MTLIPVRITEAHALHLGDPTGKGYKALCGLRIEATEDHLPIVPMPRFPRSRRHVELYWAQCWRHERICLRCDKAEEKL